MSGSAPPPTPDQTPERQTSSVEPLWDLVFVFAVAQVTTLLAALHSYGSAFRLRMTRALSRGRLSVAGALLVLFAATENAPAWTVDASVTVLIVGLCALTRSPSIGPASPPPQTVAWVADPDHGLE